MSKKSRGKGSVLSRQKPKKGRKRPLLERLRRLGLGVAACAVVGGLVYGGWRLTHGSSASTASGGAPQWQVTLRLADDTPLPEKSQEEIVTLAQKNLGRGTRKGLLRAAQAIQQVDSYADVHVVKLSPTSVAVQVRQRTPVLCIEADKLRLVSSAGEVYGQADRTKPETCPGPVVTGVFDRETHYALARDFTLALGDEEAALVKEAVELLKLGKARGYAFSKLDVKKYRGFFATLAGSETEVAVGRSPFDGKLAKLQGILDKLAQKNEQALRIELDYQGKAFIKLKKM